MTLGNSMLKLSNTTEVSGSVEYVDYLGLLCVYFEVYPLQPSDIPLHVAEDRFKEVADRRIIEIPDVQFGLYSIGVLIYCECEHDRADRVTMLDT